MDSSSFAGKQSPTRSPMQLQGTRPPPLSIHKGSHKIKKPPKPPADSHHHHHHHHHHNPHPPQPVIIYSVSPKVIHATVADFMSTVQRLTGVSSDNFCNAGDVSPAARLASIEKVSPKEKVQAPIEMVEEGTTTTTTTQVSRVPGILSPSTLPPVIQEMYFSPPVTDPNPFNYNLHGGSSGLLASPSSFFSGALGSPILSPEFFGQIWNF